jgi:hypothetical protein
MNVNDLIFSRPLATEEEKAERIGPLTKGSPDFRPGRAEFGCLRSGSCANPLDPLAMAGPSYIWPVTIGIVILLSIVLLFLPANHLGLSARRWIP